MIRLTSARLGGLEIFPGVQLANSAGPALALQNATAEWVRLSAKLLCAPDACGCCGTFTRKDGRLKVRHLLARGADPMVSGHHTVR